MAVNLHIDLKISDSAKRSLKEWMKASGMAFPVPGIVWAEFPDAGMHADWVVGLYEREKISAESPGFFLSDGDLDLFVPQESFATDRLKGAMLDLVNGQYTILPGR